MPKATAVLFGIEDEFDVLSLDRLDFGQVKIIIELGPRRGRRTVAARADTDDPAQDR